jgi:uncharacterized repeat protein (TIGR04052 family)
MRSSLVVLLFVVGCGAPAVPVELVFEPRVGGAPFACGTTAAGVGSTATAWEPQDFRFYAHDFVLLDAEGGEHALELASDTPWQHEGVALLDFEDGSGACANGTAEVNAAVRGEVHEGEYVGLRFVLGVPFALNHADAATAASPLNLSTMFWNWQGGYKFLRVEGATTGQPQGAIFHLGSTGCSADANGDVTGCSAENRAVVEVTDFDPTAEPVVADLDALFAGANLDVNAAGSAGGCMSTPGDADCASVFANLGLLFGDADAGVQSFFRAE